LKVVIDTSVDESRWDKLIAAAPGGNIFQSATWARYQKEYFGVQNFFFRLEDSHSGQPLALLRAGRESRFNRLLFEKPLGSLVLPPLDRLFAELRVEQGPVFLSDKGQKEKAAMLNTLLGEAEKFCRAQGIISLKGTFGSIYEAGEDNLEIEEVMRTSGYRDEPAATFLVDLRQDEDTLWGNLKPSTRNKIRRAQDQEIKIETVKYDSELAPYHDFFCRCRRSLGLKAPSLRTFNEMWRILRPAGMLEIFYASRDSEILGGLGAWQHAGVVFEWGSVQSEKAREQKIYCSDLLKWELIRRGHAEGHRLYDLAGVVPRPDQADPKKKGIYDFKAKWGGAFRSFNTYTKPVKPVRERILQVSLNTARRFSR